MSPRISVAMATFNGEEYLREQLQSLLHQTYPPCELLVGDDGSTDGTLALLEEFARRAPFSVRITKNAENMGFADNFLTTASCCTGDWIAFCDQDDFWLPHRLADAAAAIEQGTSDLVLVLQPAWLMYGDCVRRDRLFPTPPVRKSVRKGGHYGFWVWLGFCQTVRADLVREIPWLSRPASIYPDRIVTSHDRWTCILANALGTTAFLKRSCAYYRRHEGSLTGFYRRLRLAGSLSAARKVGAAHYAMFARSARETAECLEVLSRAPGQQERQHLFEEGGRRFRGLERILSLRANLYATDRFGARLGAYLRIWGHGGYVGPRFSAMGLRSAAKDACRVLMPAGHLQEPLQDRPAS